MLKMNRKIILFRQTDKLSAPTAVNIDTNV